MSVTLANPQAMCRTYEADIKHRSPGIRIRVRPQAQRLPHAVLVQEECK